MFRRSILLATALAPLAACAGKTPAQIAAQAVSDAQLIVKGLSAEMPLISALTNVPAATLAKLSGDFSAVIAVGQSITADLTAAQAGPLIEQIAGYVGDALTIATTSPVNAVLPPGVLPVLEAANALLPVLMAAVGLVGAAPAPAVMTPDVARATLAAA